MRSLATSVTGTLPALAGDVSTTLAEAGNSVQAQVEALLAVAKKHHADGHELQALETYKTAAGLMLGAPWLQHRTAELARKLKQSEVAALHYRRAAAAFIRAGFPKRALAPLRSGWQVSVALLPGASSAFITLSLELISAQRELGLVSEAKLTLSNSNLALKTAGSSDRVPSAAELEIRLARAKSSVPPASGVTASAAAGAGSSEALVLRRVDSVKP